MPPKIEMIGRRFGRLTVNEENGRDKKGVLKWKCICQCGNVITVTGSDLRRKKRPTHSCGCLTIDRRKEALTTHGMKGTPEYGAWRSMKNRCYNSNLENYKYYGERGIKVCERWLNSFENFIEDNDGFKT